MYQPCCAPVKPPGTQPKALPPNCTRIICKKVSMKTSPTKIQLLKTPSNKLNSAFNFLAAT
jgi:hypothetical protein